MRGYLDQKAWGTFKLLLDEPNLIRPNDEFDVFAIIEKLRERGVYAHTTRTHDYSEIVSRYVKLFIQTRKAILEQHECRSV